MITIEDLKSAGASDSFIVTVLESVQNREMERGRNRKREWRKSKASVLNPALVDECPVCPGTDGTSRTRARLTSCSNLLKKDKMPIRRKQQLPHEWQPNLSDIEYKAKLGLTDKQFDSSLEAMRLWAEANGATKMDWHATFKGFLRRDAEKPLPAAAPWKNGNGNGDWHGKRDAAGFGPAYEGQPKSLWGKV